MEPLNLDGDFGVAAPAAATTGRYLVLLEDDVDTGAKALHNFAGLSVARSSDFKLYAEDELSGYGAFVFDHLGVALVEPDPTQLQALNHAVSGSPSLVGLEPERIVYAIASEEYLRGYRDGVTQLTELVLGGRPAASQALPGLPVDDDVATWGLRATNVLQSPYTGLNAHVAVLDTGFDLNHPDFNGRSILPESFVPGESPQDAHGHGTHCIGTACGPQNPASGPRYGVASNASIFAGKVLNNRGRGADGWILAGINRAISLECHVISMSLGAPTQVGDKHSPAFERAAQRALARGTLIVAAAGNESGRPAHVASVGHPANCPSIMAVAAIDSAGRVASFSNGGLNPEGGQVDIAAPGVGIRSSWPMPTRHRSIDGTSMATPHVAGIAALMVEAGGGPKGTAGGQLWARIVQRARRLSHPSIDVGAGLVQAP